MSEGNGHGYRPRGHMGFWRVALIGLGPIALIAGFLFALRHYAGSWERAGGWIFYAFMIAAATGVLSLISAGIGQMLWYGDIDTVVEGRGGLSKIRDERRERKAALEAAKRQDGQISVADDVLGRVSLGDAEGRK